MRSAIQIERAAAGSALIVAWVKSEDDLFDDLEMAFGRIEPGQSKSFTAELKVEPGRLLEQLKAAVAQMQEDIVQLSGVILSQQRSV